MGEFHAVSRQKNLSFLKNIEDLSFLKNIENLSFLKNIENLSFLKNIHRIHVHAARDIGGGF